MGQVRMIGIDAAKLAAAVINSGMGEGEICARAGIAHQTFSKMLMGKMVRFPSVGRVCKILDLQPAEIIKELSVGSGNNRNETIQAQE